ncbi:hypothetical protein P8C59_004336 [Phyllachora maydis]|nr:hypothetical protein P8C59_004336 [Phyllachora maydis]
MEELQLLDTARGSSKADPGQVSKAGEQVRQLLRIKFQHLKAMNEMRKLFGKGTMEAVEAERDTGQDRPQRTHRRVRENVGLEEYLQAPGKGMPEMMLRRNIFIEGKRTWPRASSGGLTMNCLTQGNGDSLEFSFAHDKVYQTLEMQFYSLVQMYDPMQMVHFLQRNPYHVSSLIQVSKVAKQDQNAALAADLCERALFTFGRITLSSFRRTLEEGRARIDFYRPENRQFFLAGHNYIKNLMQKGTYRTALEWTKLLVSVAPNDPYDMLNWAHVLAIRAFDAQWWIDVCNSDLLESCESRGNVEYIKQSIVTAKLLLKDVEGAKESLRQGMQRLPWLYCALYSALDMDSPRSVWGVQPRDAEEVLHTELYIHLAKDLWNYPAAMSILKEVGEALPKVRPDALPASVPVSLGTARFVYLENTPSLMSCVPRNMLHASPNFDFDPLPPAKELNRFSHDWQKLPWESPSSEESRLDHAPAGMPRAMNRGIEDMDNLRAELVAFAEADRAQRGPGGAGGEEEDGHAAREASGSTGTGTGLVGILQRIQRQFLGTQDPDFDDFDDEVDEVDEGDEGDQVHLTAAQMPGAWDDEFDDWMDQEDDMGYEGEDGFGEDGHDSAR